MERGNSEESFGPSLDLDYTYDFIPTAMESVYHNAKTPENPFPFVVDLIEAGVSTGSNEIDSQNGCNTLHFSIEGRAIYGIGKINSGNESVEGLKKRRTKQE